MRSPLVPVPDSGEDTSDFEAMVVCYVALNQLKAKIESRLNEMKPILHKCAEELGSQNSKGSYEFPVGEEKIIRRLRIDTFPNEDQLRALLETKKIEHEKVFDEKKVSILNASKLQQLVAQGRLQQHEVDDLRGRGYALCPAEGRTLADLLREALGDEPVPSNSDRRSPTKSK